VLAAQELAARAVRAGRLEGSRAPGRVDTQSCGCWISCFVSCSWRGDARPVLFSPAFAQVSSFRLRSRCCSHLNDRLQGRESPPGLVRLEGRFSSFLGHETALDTTRLLCPSSWRAGQQSASPSIQPRKVHLPREWSPTLGLGLSLFGLEDWYPCSLMGQDHPEGAGNPGRHPARGPPRTCALSRPVRARRDRDPCNQATFANAGALFLRPLKPSRPAIALSRPLCRDAACSLFGLEDWCPCSPRSSPETPRGPAGRFPLSASAAEAGPSRTVLVPPREA
jgi:hypothetical protein